jgi:hypothetical protein
MSMTLAEKILARPSGRHSVKPGEYVVGNIALAMTQERRRGVYPTLEEAGVTKVWSPEKEEGDTLELGLEKAQVRNLNRKISLRGTPLPREILEVLLRGGMTPLLKEMFGSFPNPSV